VLSSRFEEKVKNPRGAGAETVFGRFVKPVHHWQDSKVPAREPDHGSVIVRSA
jgi:hypothetical protein